LNPNDKHKCSGKTTKGWDCKGNGTVKVGNLWYCPPHQNQGQEDSDSSESEDDENEINQIQNNTPRSLLPVTANHSSNNILKLTKCNGKFGNEEPCDVFIFKEDDAKWRCPLHDKKYLKPEDISETTIKTGPEIKQPEKVSVKEAVLQKEVKKNEDIKISKLTDQTENKSIFFNFKFFFRGL
jgi:hypothetical protein